MTFSDRVRTVLESFFSSFPPFFLPFFPSFFLSSLRLRLDRRKSPQRSLRFHRRGAATPVKALFRLGSTGTTILNVSVGVRARENQYSGSKNDAKKRRERGGKGHHHTYRRRVSLRANALLQNMHAKLRSFKWTCARRNGQHDTGMYMEGFIRY